MTKLRVLDLFSGIGGFSLGLERAYLEGVEYDGFETVAFCEIEDFPRRVLARHWPGVPCYRDVRELTAARLATDGIAVDVITGGFPCQDISNAGKGKGLAGERSGLWSEIARLADELRPEFIIVENVAALLNRGMGQVLGDLASLGYDAEWNCIPASAIGAPHIRDRVWIVAYPAEDGWEHVSCNFAHKPTARWNHAAHQREDIGGQLAIARLGPRLSNWPALIAEAFASRCGQLEREPKVVRVADGLPDELGGVAALGNAVVPQIPELIGNAILAALAGK